MLRLSVFLLLLMTFFIEDTLWATEFQSVIIRAKSDATLSVRSKTPHVMFYDTSSGSDKLKWNIVADYPEKEDLSFFYYPENAPTEYYDTFRLGNGTVSLKADQSDAVMNIRSAQGKSSILKFWNGNEDQWGFVSNFPKSDQFTLFSYFTSHRGPIATFNKTGEMVLGGGWNNTKAKIREDGKPYLLTVHGGIYATDLRIRPKSHADFVFDPNYELMSLAEVEKTIDENRHLPGIPSTKEVLENGVSVADMQAALLMKIEELTLYIIDQNKKIEAQARDIEQLKKERSLRLSITNFSSQLVNE